jgi:hypothetical protein
MSEPIQRDGVWWHQKADGNWLRWNAQKNVWEHAPAAPPPPAPPPGTVAQAFEPSGPQTAEPAFGFSVADPTPSEAAVAAEAAKTDPAPVVEAVFSADPEPRSFAAANGDVLPPESDKPTVGDWVQANRTIAAIVAAVLLVGALAFAALTFLGGDKPAGASGTTSQATPGAAAVKKVAVRKLNTLCTDARRDIERFTYPTTPAEFVVYMGKVKGVYGKFMDKLVRIDPGPKNQETFRKIVKDFRTTASYADDVLAAARAGDLARIQSTLNDLQAASAEMNGRARAFGAHACASA